MAKVNQPQQTTQINTNTFKAGRKKSEIKNNQAAQSIFDMIDKNKDGILSAQETVAVKDFKGRISNKIYVRIRYLKDGNFLVADQAGKLHVMKKDGTVLNGVPQQYIAEVYPNGGNPGNPYKVSTQKVKTLSILNALGEFATKKFNDQMEKDGWAADAADGISKIWNNSLGERMGISTGNTASQVRKDLKAYEQNMKRLNNAAQKGDAEFNAEFKRIFGVDYDQNAIDAFLNKKTEGNWHKAFGSKPDIATRVLNYNASQDTGAEAVKTTTKVAGAVAIGVATGGTGLVALGATAAGAAAISATVEYADDVKVTKAVTDGKIERRGKKSNEDILKGAAIDGALTLTGGVASKVASTVVASAGMKGVTKFVTTAAIEGTEAVTTGAAVEYAETGEVTLGGTLTNAAMSLGGSVAAEATPFVKKIFKGGGDEAHINSTSEPHSTGNNATVDNSTKLTQNNTVDVDIDDDLNRWYTMGDLRAGADIPKVIQDTYSYASISKLSTYLAEKTKNPDLYMEAIAQITERIKAGEVPSKKMIEGMARLIKEQVGGPTSDISTTLLLGLRKIDEMKAFTNSPYFLNNTATATSPGYKKRYKQFMDDIDKAKTQPAPKPEVKEPPTVKTDEADVTVKPNEVKAEPTPKLDDEPDVTAKSKDEQKAPQTNADAPTLDYYLEKYPELKDMSFNKPESLKHLGEAMEKYEQYLKEVGEINYENFDSSELYRLLGSIESNSDVDAAFQFMKEKYHPDVIAEEHRISGLKAQGLDNEMVKAYDEIIEDIKLRQANGEPISLQDIENAIEEKLGYNAVRNDRVRGCVLNDQSISSYLNENINIDIVTNKEYARILEEDGFEKINAVYNDIAAAIQKGEIKTSEDLLNIIYKHKQASGGFTIGEDEVLRDILSTNENIQGNCKDIIDDVLFRL